MTVAENCLPFRNGRCIPRLWGWRTLCIGFGSLRQKGQRKPVLLRGTSRIALALQGSGSLSYKSRTIFKAKKHAFLQVFGSVNTFFVHLHVVHEERKLAKVPAFVGWVSLVYCSSFVETGAVRFDASVIVEFSGAPRVPVAFGRKSQVCNRSSLKDSDIVLRFPFAPVPGSEFSWTQL